MEDTIIVKEFVMKQTRNCSKTNGQLYYNQNYADMIINIFHSIGYNAMVSIRKGGTVGIKYYKI